MLNSKDLGKLLRALDKTGEEELGCDECFEQLDRFVETELAGLDARSAIPLVRDHLDKCGDCRQEYRALLDALRASESSLPVGRLWIRVRQLFFGTG